MPKMATQDQPVWLHSINMDVFRTDDGDPIAILGFATEEGMNEFYMGKEGAQALIKALTNFVDFSEGREISHPTSH